MTDARAADTAGDRASSSGSGDAHVRTAGQDARALAARSATALDRHAATAGVLETQVADLAGGITTSAVDVHEHARHQAEQAAQRVQEIRRARSGPAATGACACPHCSRTQIQQAARVVTDAGSASALTVHITELVQHAADVSAASELELLTTAAAARQLLDRYPDTGLQPVD